MNEFFKACNVYCCPKANRAIVAATFNHGGLIAEKPGGASLIALSDSSGLNQNIQSALSECEFRESFGYTGRRCTDGPAFQASGFKTVKRFEAEFIYFAVRGVNEKNLFYEVRSPAFGEYGLHLNIVVNADAGEYSEAVHYLLQQYLRCRPAAG